jgi:hypothetical protein
MIEYDELKRGFGFLVIKLMDMELKTGDGHEICPMFGFCEDCEDCFLDRVMEESAETIPDNTLTPLKPEWDMFTSELCHHLNFPDPDSGLHYSSCDGSFKISRNIIENRFPKFDLEATINYFKKSEWYCDCEVFCENPVYLGKCWKTEDEINV